jgi:REP element-mobilizing transposase RayT
MANSYASLFAHVIFSTHNREPVLISEFRNRLWAYMGGIARTNKFSAITIGGFIDHAHMLIKVPAILPIAKAVQLIKGGSSKWVHENIRSLYSFQWQEGYAAFSIGASQVDNAIKYIANQDEHHRKKTFQEEYLDFLKEYNIEYDEKYVWG